MDRQFPPFGIPKKGLNVGRNLQYFDFRSKQKANGFPPIGFVVFITSWRSPFQPFEEDTLAHGEGLMLWDKTKPCVGMAQARPSIALGITESKRSTGDHGRS